MKLTLLIKLVILASIALSVLAVSLGATLRDATSLLHQPGALLRSVIAMNVMMPLFAFLLAFAFPFDPAVRIALVTLSVSPVMPLVVRKQLKAGADAAYSFGLYTAITLLAIIFVPVAVVVVGRIAGFSLGISAGAVARTVVISILAPLALGIVVHARYPALAERLARPIDRIATAILLVTVLVVVAGSWRSLLAVMGNGTLLAFIAFVLGGLLLGEVFGGTDPDKRMVLALSNASRHPGVALAIAGVNFPDQKLVIAAVLVYLVVNGILALQYLRWNRHPPTLSVPGPRWQYTGRRPH